MAKPFVTPFATGGDKSAVPDASQADGSVSYTQGFGPDYQQEQGTPGAKDISRDKTNQLFNDITAALSEIQRRGFAEYYPELAPYEQGAAVWRAGTVYMSTAGNNNTVPGAAGSSWIVLGGDTTPVGTTILFNADSPPPGYVIENGLAVPRTGQYAALFSVVGTRFGAGNGTTTFNLPESRGEYPRFADAGRGVDPGRTVGSFRGESVPSHTHTVTGETRNFLRAGAGGISGPSDAGLISATAGGVTPVAGTPNNVRSVAKLACIKF